MYDYIVRTRTFNVKASAGVGTGTDYWYTVIRCKMKLHVVALEAVNSTTNPV